MHVTEDWKWHENDKYITVEYIKPGDTIKHCSSEDSHSRMKGLGVWSLAPAVYRSVLGQDCD